jgi:hypothetical protein
MTDIAALKAAAERASTEPFAVNGTTFFRLEGIYPANAALIRLANPSAILFLIASHEALVEALREVRRQSGLLMHQNIGRWDVRVEHDKRSSDVTATNIEIISRALSAIEKGEEA